MEFPGKLESTNLSMDNLGGEMGRTTNLSWGCGGGRRSRALRRDNINDINNNEINNNDDTYKS